MNDIQHQPNRWLVVWANNPLLIQGTDGQYTATSHSYTWYETEAEGIAAIQISHPNWTPQQNPEEKALLK